MERRCDIVRVNCHAFPNLMGNCGIVLTHVLLHAAYGRGTQEPTRQIHYVFVSLLRCRHSGRTLHVCQSPLALLDFAAR